MLLEVFLSFPSIASADGGLIQWFSRDNWEFEPLNTQEAFINYHNGVEKLIITIDPKITAGSAWIIPIPAEPEDVFVDVAEETPYLLGRDFEKEVWEEIRELDKSLLFCNYLYTFLGSIPHFGAVSGRKEALPNDVSVSVFARIERGYPGSYRGRVFPLRGRGRAPVQQTER